MTEFCALSRRERRSQFLARSALMTNAIGIDQEHPDHQLEIDKGPACRFAASRRDCLLTR